MSIERKDPANVLVLGGDDPEGDARRFVESDFRIRSGLCPNGHGLMEPTSYGQQCPTCRFFCNTKPDPERPQ